jgi:hypothetical protein
LRDGFVGSNGSNESMDHQGAVGCKTIHRVIVEFDAYTDAIIDVVVKLAEELIVFRREVKEQLPGRMWWWAC